MSEIVFQSNSLITLSMIKDVLFEGKQLVLSRDVIEKVERCYTFLKTFSEEKVIYGINTGFGPMAAVQNRGRFFERTTIQHYTQSFHRGGTTISSCIRESCHDRTSRNLLTRLFRGTQGIS